MANTPLVTWLLDTWARLEKESGRRMNQQEYADYLGSVRVYIGELISGKKNNPTLETIAKWYRATGDPSVYDATGNSDVKPLSAIKSELSGVISDVAETMSSQGITDINSPEGAEIINSILERRGL